jgi:uncharacterized protein (TIGR02996 family)
MDRVVAARRLIAELVKGEHIEVRRAEIVGRDLAQLVDTLGRPPSGRELEDWLGEHAQVSELYASVTLLDDLVYRHLSPPPSDAPVVTAHHPELEQQLRDEPDDVDNYRIYADFLQQHGDPLGELIALGIAATAGGDDEQTRFERYRKAHAAHLFGGIERELVDRAELSWRYGLVDEITQGMSWQGMKSAVWEQLLGLRVCAFVRSLVLRYVSDEHDAVIANLASPSLRALTVTAGLPKALMRRSLRELTVHAESLTLGANAVPSTLERLVLNTRAITADVQQLPVRELHVLASPSVGAFLADVVWPRLERLRIGLDDRPASEMLRDAKLPALTHLAICDGILDPDALAAIAQLPVAAQLTSLALTNVELVDGDIRALARFPALTELDLSFNELTRDGLAAARELAPSVISKRQHKPGNANEKRVRRFAGSRLQVAEGIADPKAWKRAGVDGDIRWARYRGEAEYELFVSADLGRYGCSCPSSIQPCKHVVALALLAERTTLRPAPSDGIEDRVSSLYEPDDL